MTVKAVWVPDCNVPRALEYARKGYKYVAFSSGYDDTYLLATHDVTITEDMLDDMLEGYYGTIEYGDTRIVIGREY